MSFLAEVLVHTGFFLGFLPLFFFLYVAPSQAQSLTNDVFNILKPYLNSILIRMPSTQSAFSDFVYGVHTIEAIAEDELSDFSNQTKVDNDNTKRIVAIVCGVSASLLVITGIFLEWYSGGNVLTFLISNLIVLGFIAISEFAIVGLFLRNFVEIDVDFIKAILANSLANPGPWYTCKYSRNFLESLMPSWLAKLIFK